MANFQERNEVGASLPWVTSGARAAHLGPSPARCHVWKQDQQTTNRDILSELSPGGSGAGPARSR